MKFTLPQKKAPVVKLEAAAPIQAPKPVAKRETTTDESMRPPPVKNVQKRERPTEHVPSSDDQPKKKRKIVKLKVSEKTMTQIVQITASSSKKSAPKAVRAGSHAKSASPAPNRPSPKPSPGQPTSSPAQRTGLPSGPAAPRTGLPSAPARSQLPSGVSGSSKIKIKVKSNQKTGLPSKPPTVNHSASPRPTPSTTTASPVPSSTQVTNQTAPTSGSQPAKVRKPLPDSVRRSPPAHAPKRLVISIKNGKARRQ